MKVFLFLLSLSSLVLAQAERVFVADSIFCAEKVQAYYTLDDENKKITMRAYLPMSVRTDLQQAHFFFANLADYYLTLSPAHQKFAVTNRSKIQSGAKIYNVENAGGQTLEHHYVVTKLDDRDPHIRWESPETMVTGKTGIFSYKVKNFVRVDFYLAGIKNETGFATEITLQFKSGFDYKMAKKLETPKIWTLHAQEEIGNGFCTMQSKAFLDAYNNRIAE
jgi:hypothetical protein